MTATRTALLGSTLCVLFALVSTHVSAAEPEGELHVPSPDWRDQIIYFVMIDRFDDGEPDNNDQGAGEYDPADNARYSGGDLRGIARRIDYIRGLGATAVWITPPVANQWWNPHSNYGGYHGYWAEDFMAVDAHYGTLADYRDLSRRLHRAGMYLVQDVVVNHTADYFGYRGGWDRSDPAAHFELRPDARGRTAPTQWPFNLNDARNPEHRAAGIYHWTPAITDYNDREQETTFQLAGLDDLDTGNPAVRDALRKSYGHWIREVGVDGFRVDTAFYVQPDYFSDFLHADDTGHPGMLQVAAATGRDGFHVFGEGFAIDRPHEDVQARRIDRYMRDDRGTPLLPGMLNFPLYGTAVDVFARGRPTADLGHRIRSMMAVHENPHLMPSFIDNHDVDRFLAGGDEEGLKQGLLMLMTLPGIPTIYYGTEQGFSEQRGAMFAGGYGSDGRDHFDTDAPLYRYIRRAVALRREHRLFSRGTPTVLAEDAAGPGVLAWRVDYRADDDAGENCPSLPRKRDKRSADRPQHDPKGERSQLPSDFSVNPDPSTCTATALVILNTADHEALLDNLDTGLTPGRVLEGLFGIDEAPDELVVGANGRIHHVLPARSGLVWKLTGRTAPPPAATASLTLDPYPDTTFRDDFRVSGSASGVQEFKLVIDGDLASARTVRADRDGRWQATVDTADMIDPDVRHRVVAWASPLTDTPAVASERHGFKISRPWTVLADVADPEGDDHGPEGRYRYPTDPSWGQHRQLDILNVRVSGAGDRSCASCARGTCTSLCGGALQIELRMHDVTATWGPANGFDHVAFTLFVQLPGRDGDRSCASCDRRECRAARGTCTSPCGGSRVMPLQNATLPDDMQWHYRLRAHGWTNTSFSPEGASATAEGTPVMPTAHIRTDIDADTVRFTLPAAALGNLESLSGVKLYVTTWDYDGGYRGLTRQAQSHTFGGGDGNVDPLVMDDTAVITLP